MIEWKRFADEMPPEAKDTTVQTRLLLSEGNGDVWMAKPWPILDHWSVQGYASYGESWHTNAQNLALEFKSWARVEPPAVPPHP